MFFCWNNSLCIIIIIIIVLHIWRDSSDWRKKSHRYNFSTYLILSPGCISFEGRELLGHPSPKGEIQTCCMWGNCIEVNRVAYLLPPLHLILGPHSLYPYKTTSLFPSQCPGNIRGLLSIVNSPRKSSYVSKIYWNAFRPCLGESSGTGHWL